MENYGSVNPLFLENEDSREYTPGRALPLGGLRCNFFAGVERSLTGAGDAVIAIDGEEGDDAGEEGVCIICLEPLHRRSACRLSGCRCNGIYHESYVTWGERTRASGVPRAELTRSPSCRTRARAQVPPGMDPREERQQLSAVSTGPDLRGGAHRARGHEERGAAAGDERRRAAGLPGDGVRPALRLRHVRAHRPHVVRRPLPPPLAPLRLPRAPSDAAGRNTRRTGSASCSSSYGTCLHGVRQASSARRGGLRARWH